MFGRALMWHLFRGSSAQRSSLGLQLQAVFVGALFSVLWAPIARAKIKTLEVRMLGLEGDVDASTEFDLNREFLTSPSRPHSECDSLRPCKSHDGSSYGCQPASPSSVASFPTRQEESSQRRHCRIGRTEALYGKISDRNSQPSAEAEDYPRDGADDYYRNSIAEQPPTSDTLFLQAYERYKDMDAVAQGNEDNYKGFILSKGTYSMRERRRFPDRYMGQPIETRDWHAKAGEYAQRTSLAFNA